MSVTLDIQQPAPFDLVGPTILIAGNATAFEGSLSVSVTEGHDEYSAIASVGSLGLRQFQASIDIPDTNLFQLDRVFLTLADDGATADGPRVMIPLLYGPRIMPGYRGWQPYTVQSGDTLTSIASAQYGSADFQPIFRANAHILTSPDLIFPGQVLRIPRDDI
ncbi:LysM peptidoglycan-binding domain-containing protein [Yoonia sp. R2331]|uniref:LysM peptidoglycan-binding domain-containing protein n=1 Tax=Yoonia sp. R2331 TaxID=3237238 RepID=UPI0034E60458